jgi:hypothetical protein
MFERLVANTDEPETDQGCWPWRGKCDRSGYGRLNVWVPALGAGVTVMAHAALFVCLEAAPANADEFWLAYLELRHSGLELDHLCRTRSCVAPDHHEPVTPSVNCQRRSDHAKSSCARL